jgi:hypothetical protein
MRVGMGGRIREFAYMEDRVFTNRFYRLLSPDMAQILRKVAGENLMHRFQNKKYSP